MKRYVSALSLVAVVILIAAAFALSSHPAEGSVLGILGATSLPLIGVTRKSDGSPMAPMAFEKNAEGKIVLSPDELTGAIEQGIERFSEVHKLGQAPAPPAGAAGTGAGAAGASVEEQQKAAAKLLAVEPAGEKPTAKIIRLGKAITEVRGMRLAIEDAPKEIKFNAYLRACHDRDELTMRTLGMGSYPEAIRKALTEGSAADGGNLVPIEFATDLLYHLETYGVMRRDAMQVPMTSNEKDLRTVTTKPTISRKGELVASDEGAPKFGKPQLTVDMYTGHQIISREEMDDNNVNLYQNLIALYGEQFQKAEDTEGLTGSYYPGVLQSVTPTLTTIAATSIADVTYKELVAFNRSLSAGQLRNGGKYYMNRTIFGVIEGMTDDNGRPITTSPFSNQGATLFGYPVELSEVMPALSADAANTGFIIFGNLFWVAFGSRQGMFTQLLREATLVKSGGGSVNLAEQRAIALAIDIRWGVKVTIPANLAVLKTHA